MTVFYSQIEHQNISISTDDLVEDSQDGRWDLDVSDRYSNSRRQNRYFLAKSRCKNCNQFGHFMRDCPDPIKEIRCYMCGNTGHREDRCPKSCCLGCGNPDHMFRTICNHCKLMERVVCKECGFYGHKRQSCPDLWRRYHSTTTCNNNSNESPLRPRKTDSHKKRNEQWCCNCGRRGHLVDDCRRSRYSEYPVRPVIVQSYEAVKRLAHIVSSAKKEMDSQSSKKSKNKKKKSYTTSQSPPPKRRKMDHHQHQPPAKHVKQRRIEKHGKEIWKEKKLSRKDDHHLAGQKMSRGQRRKEAKKKKEQKVQKKFRNEHPQYEFKLRGKVQEVKPWKKKKGEMIDTKKYFNLLAKAKRKGKGHVKF
eukprot:TRINITY_DN79703_c0_g1_i1.p1 TRINITY_DN79703_c0_g1~~TRINITY_DN79703_c0_g1_i1.p1  ORF type:complete len:362 (+),score=69.01 TRINITY_DN79703_c0_g1_i1:2-1087(+)